MLVESFRFLLGTSLLTDLSPCAGITLIRSIRVLSQLLPLQVSTPETLKIWSKITREFIYCL